MSDYAFFEVGTSWDNGIRLAKDGADNFRFIVWAGSREYGVAHGVGDWQAGEWHHIAATWHESEIALYEDGVLVGHEAAQNFNQLVIDHRVFIGAKHAFARAGEKASPAWALGFIWKGVDCSLYLLLKSWAGSAQRVCNERT